MIRLLGKYLMEGCMNGTQYEVGQVGSEKFVILTRTGNLHLSSEAIHKIAKREFPEGGVEEYQSDNILYLVNEEASHSIWWLLSSPHAGAIEEKTL